MLCLAARLLGACVNDKGPVAVVAVTLNPLLQLQCRHITLTKLNYVAHNEVKSRDSVLPYLRCDYRDGDGRKLQKRVNNVKKKDKKGEGKSSITTTLRSFPLGNGVEVHLQAPLPIFEKGKEMVSDMLQQPHQANNFIEDSLDATLETIRLSSGSTSLISISETDLLNSFFGNTKSNMELEGALQSWPEVLHRLKTIALPLLLKTPDVTLFSVSSLLEACQILKETLTVVDNVSKVTGLRTPRIFPPPLVLALWESLPRLYVHAQRLGQEPEHRGDELLPPAFVENSTLLMKEFKSVRRALALRTRELNDLLSPRSLLHVLVCMEQCGALSDDIIGPIVSNLLRRYKTSVVPLDSPQRIATNHLLSTRFVASVTDAEVLPFQGESVLTFVRLLGRAQLPGHFQLHRLLHTILLPALVPALQACTPDEIALFEVTKCYVRYAVSGSAVAQLTSLWMPHLSHMTLDKCTELLSVVGGSLRSSSGSGGSDVVATGAEEEYLPLVEAVLQRAYLLCSEGTQGACNVPSPNAMMVPTSSSACVNVTARFISSLAKVNSANWGEVYLVAATLLERELDKIPIMEVSRVAKALLRRNSHLPHHSLHSRLAHRLLSDETALTDVKMGNVSLLAAAMMLSTCTASRGTSSASHGNQRQYDSHFALEEHLVDTFIPVLDTDRALTVFRRHGTKLGLCSFVAGMCVASLAQLPRRSQERVIMHFTSIASAIEVPWLVRGMVALTTQIPEAVDPLSVQRWFSRFTAVDVTRQLDMEHAALLLNILSDDGYSRDSALAKQAIVKWTGKLLLQESAPLEVVNSLAFALQRANVFFPYLYSRICRVLLANVGKASWKLLLPAFYAAADEFTRRQHSNGSVFRDVWEQLRTRLMEEAASSLEAEDVVLALNGFAALDGRDRPVFAVLVHRLWEIYQSVSNSVDKGMFNTKQLSSLQLPVRPSVWVDGVLSGCTPSALAVLIATLIYMREGDVVNTFMPWILLRVRPIVRDLYPIDVLHLMPALLSSFTLAAAFTDETAHEGASWLCNPVNCTILHATYDGCREIFLYMYGDELTAGDPKALRAQRTEWSPKVHMSVSQVPRYLFAELLVQLCQSGVQDNVVATAAAARMTWRACARLPIADLVDLILALCFHFPPPTPFLPQKQVVEDSSDDTIREDDAKTKEPANGLSSYTTTEGHVKDEASSSLSLDPPHRRFLLPALNALWERVEELEVAQMDALLRCLKHYYGDKVDTNFLERLEKHKATLEAVRMNHQRRRETAAKRDGERGVAVDASSVSTTGRETMLLGELTAGDLFEL